MTPTVPSEAWFAPSASSQLGSLRWEVQRLYAQFKGGARMSRCHRPACDSDPNVPFLYFLHRVRRVSLLSLTPGLVVPKARHLFCARDSPFAGADHFTVTVGHEAVWLGSQTGSLHNTKTCRCQLQKESTDCLLVVD